MADAGLGLAEQNLKEAMEQGSIPERPTWPLGRLLMTAIFEGALVAAECDDEQRKRFVGVSLRALLDGLCTPGVPSEASERTRER
jgi:hypothetical protein